MSTDLIANQNSHPATFQKQGLPGAHHGNVGAIAIEQERAIAEAQGQLTLAKRFPRNLNTAYEELMEACASPAFAATAFYSVPNRGSGPSIRFAEEVARVYGNFQYGHRELSRSEGKSEVEVYAWDMEKNNRSIRQITVMHILDTKNGSRRLVDQADIDNKIANVASKQIRGRILALMPKWLVADAIEKCKATIAGTSEEPIASRVRKMIGAFARFGVNADMLEKYIGHSLDDTTLDELVDLTGVYNAIHEGVKPSEYFAGQTEGEDEKKQAINAKIGGGKGAPEPEKKKAAPEPEPEKSEEQEEAPKNTGRKPAQKAAEKEPEQAPAQQASGGGEPGTDFF